LRGGDHLGYLIVDESVILKKILKKEIRCEDVN
jgi:hypothetical protein